MSSESKKNFELKKDELKVLMHDLRRFKLAVDNASDHIVITDPKGYIIYANKAAENVTGYDFEEMVGKKAGGRDLWGGFMGNDFYEALWNAIAVKKESFIGEVNNRRKNGEEYAAEISISPVLSSKNEVLFFVGIERDITQQKELEEAKTEFVSLASHQLRTPLTNMSLGIDMLLRGAYGELNLKQKEALQDIYRDVHNMAELANALLSVSRIEMGNFEMNKCDFDLAGLIADILTEYRHLIDGKKLRVARNLKTYKYKLHNDRMTLKIIIQNIVANAIKYTPKKGRINIGLRQDSTNYILTIEDNGPGIPKSEQPHIFEKFYRTKTINKIDASGTGLGLYLAKSLIDALGGALWFESEEGHGSKFYISIPIE